MKTQADKKHTERVFQVGDKVFLKLQPYVQASVVHRSNHKLAFRYYGPYEIVQRIGEVHDSLPADDLALQVPFRLLQQRLHQRGARSVLEGLIQWSNTSPEDATSHQRP